MTNLMIVALLQGRVCSQMEWFKSAEGSSAAFEDAKTQPHVIAAYLYGERTDKDPDDGSTECGPLVAQWQSPKAGDYLDQPVEFV